MLFGRVVPNSLCDIGMLPKSQDANGDIAECRHDPGTGLRSNAAAIFVVGNITDIMQLVFNAPVFAVDLKESFRTGFIGSKAGNTAHHFVAERVSIKVGHRALDPHYLFVIGKLNVSFELGAGPDSSGFDPSVSFVHRFMLRGEKTPYGGS